MKKRIRKLIMGILLVVFLVSTALMLRQFLDNAGGEAAYAEAVQIAGTRQEKPEPQKTEPVSPQTEPGGEPVCRWVSAPVENDPVMEELANINLAALREENPDVVGWIRIPDTKIDYPLMQGEDNDFYLNHTWKKEPSSVGSIFLEWGSSPDLTDFNTIVYGHNMNNGAMFADLELFSLKKFWQTHPYVYLRTDAGVYRYEIFAFYQAEVDSLTYALNPQRDDTKEAFLKLAQESAWFDSGIRPALTDRFLTLSTCSGANYDYRYVVQARLPMVEVRE